MEGERERGKYGVKEREENINTNKSKKPDTNVLAEVW